MDSLKRSEFFKTKTIAGRTPQLTENDISLLKLESNIMININTRPVRLTKASKKPFEEIFAGCNFRFWPTQKEAINFKNEYDWEVQRKHIKLINAAVEIISIEKCLEEHKDILLTSYQVCGRYLENTRMNDSLLSNSGGPLVCNKLQKGFFSWQKVSGNSVLLVFTKTDDYNYYIKRNIPRAVFYDGGLPKNTRRSMDGFDFLRDSAQLSRWFLFILMGEILILGMV